MIKAKCKVSCHLDGYWFIPENYYYIEKIDEWQAYIYNIDKTPISLKKASLDTLEHFFVMFNIELV